MVLKFGENIDPIKFNYLKINPKSDSRIYSRKMEKQYIPVCKKGIINENLDVLPFGYE